MLQLYTEIVNNMLIGLTVWQLEIPDNWQSFKLVLINPAAANIFNVKIEDVVGKKLEEISEYLLPAIIPEIYLEVINSGISQDLGEIYYGKDDIKNLFSAKVFALPNNCVGVTFENITDRKWLEDLLQDARSYAEVIVETIQQPLVVLNADLRVKTANKAFYQKFQFSTAETDNKFIYNLGNGQWNILELRVLLEKIIPNNTEFKDFEIEQYFPTIGHRTMLLNARSIYRGANRNKMILLAIEDITERKQIELKLKSSEAKFRGIVDTAQEGIWLLNNNVHTTYINQRIADMLGYNINEILGSPFFNFMDAAAYQEAELHFQRHQQGIKEHYDFRFRRQDGSDLWAIVSINPLLDEQGKFLGALAMLTDITDRKRIENDLKIFTAKLEQSNRELQDFASVASHDLQEPLRKIQAFGDRLKTKFSHNLNEEGLDYLERMQSAAKRMKSLINDLLTFSRITTKAQPFQQINLLEVVQEVLLDLEIPINQVGAIIEIGELPSIEADGLQMRQLFQNLISNALKFHRQETLPLIKIESKIEQNSEINLYCQISIEDNGIGFDEKYLDRIFTVFQKLHSRNEYEGTGIGLAICRKIVERHGGTITAHSTPGNGATFMINLPVHQLNEKS